MDCGAVSTDAAASVAAVAITFAGPMTCSSVFSSMAMPFLARRITLLALLTDQFCHRPRSLHAVLSKHPLRRSSPNRRISLSLVREYLPCETSWLPLSVFWPQGYLQRLRSWLTQPILHPSTI